jgi:uncharacterized surface protein with fasciclin (FAS1) repeats
MKKILFSAGLGSLVLSTSVIATFAQGMVETETRDSLIKISTNLTIGSHGDNVVALQTFLESKGYLIMPENTPKGYFGNLTKMALKKYQAEVGVPVTGFFGPLTRAKWMSMNSDTSMSNNDSVIVGRALMNTSRDIVDNAVLASNVTTLVAAVKAAGLVETLKSKGPFTVFAPNNNAFAALPAGTVESLLLPENKSKLTDILTYHVIAGTYRSKDLYNSQTLTTVNGKKITITKVDGKVLINGSAMVETADAISSNGVTHVIDKVLLP